MSSDPKTLMKEALAEAKMGLSEGGLPIGMCTYVTNTSRYIIKSIYPAPRRFVG